MRKHSIMAAILVVAAAGCASSQAEQVKDARMERAEQGAQASTAAVEENAEHRQDAIDASHAAADKQLERANQPGENPNQELVQVSADRTTYENKAVEKLEKFNVRLSAAQQKLTALGSQAPINLRGELKTANTEYQTISQDVKSLRGTPATGWEAKTATIEKRMSSLDDRISKLDDAIDDV